MSKPNKTVGNWLRRNPRPRTPEMEAAANSRLAHSVKTNWASWAMSKVSEGVVFNTEAEARAAFDNRPDSDRA